MPSTDAEQELVTTTEAAKLLQIHPRRIIRKVERGALVPNRKLPGIRGAYLFNLEDIESMRSEEASA